MTGTFLDRTAELLDQLGEGRVVARIVVDQVYARAQHERLDYRHPHGGGPKYLGGTLMDNFGAYLREIARRVIVPEGTDLVPAMIDVVEEWSKDSAKAAPIWFADLRNSMHPTVTQGSVTHYDRAPYQRRLTPEELALKERWRP